MRVFRSIRRPLIRLEFRVHEGAPRRRINAGTVAGPLRIPCSVGPSLPIRRAF